MNKDKILSVYDSKFKTAAISVNFYRKLSRDEVTYNALLPAVLKQGCNRIPNTRDLNQYLEELYGAVLNFDVKKCGDTHVISFYISTISDSFTESEHPFEESINLLNDVIYSPFVTNNAFSEKYVETEKKNLKELIESVKNDKREYAKKRLIEEMYKNESYGIFEYGYTEDLENINGANLYEYYRTFIETSEMKIIVCGNYDTEIIQKIESVFPTPTISHKLPEISFGGYKKEPEYISEAADITQGKLTIGYRSDITREHELYFAMLVLNNLFGGAPHSKLFLNVREKLSLAYYAGSGYNSFKGLILVNCGIEFDKYNLTVEEVNKQLQNIIEGNITEEEIAYSKSALTTGYSAINDSLSSQISFYTSQSLGSSKIAIDDFISNINSVTKSDIVKASKSIHLDTVYFLKGEDL